MGSSRFPGKPLIDIKGKSMIYRVWKKCALASNKKNIIVATDDNRIVDHCKNSKINVILTSSNCLTGTDRIGEVAKKIEANIYIKFQGDEPLISHNDIPSIIEISKNERFYRFR